MVSDIPIYSQLCQQIIKGIAKKEFNEGDELPSVRNLAKDLGVNLHTINKAYNILKQDGFLVVNRRKGVVVNASNGYEANEDYKSHLKESMATLIIEATARGLSYEDLNQTLIEILEELKGERS